MKLFLSLFLAVVFYSAVRAQELPRPSLAREESGTKSLPTDYNIKAGPVLLNFNSSIEAEYVDNLGLNSNDKLYDITLTPELGIGARWPITESNTLELTTSVGYTKYLIHPQFDSSSVNVAPDSKLSFDVYTGNFKINFHDDFSFQQDPVDEAALSNVVNFNRFLNDAGITVLWDLNKVILSLSYDHINFIATQLQTSTGQDIPDPDNLNYSADQVSASAEAHLSSTLIGGIEGAASIRQYDQGSGGDYDQLSAGPYVKFQVTEHLKAELSGGYQYISSPDTTGIISAPVGIGQVAPLAPQTNNGDDGSFYVDLSLDHQLNSRYLHRLSLGHDIQLGLLGEQSDVTYINYTGSWHVNSRLNVSFTLGYQDVTQSGGFFQTGPYDVYTAAIQASYPISKNGSGSVFYQLNDKQADNSFDSYTQNRVGFIFTYHF